jgi:hypothetical protein
MGVSTLALTDRARHIQEHFKAMVLSCDPETGDTADCVLTGQESTSANEVNLKQAGSPGSSNVQVREG